MRNGLKVALGHLNIPGMWVRVGLPIQTLTLQPNEAASQDTFVQESAPTTSATNAATLATNGQAGARRNTLIKFDLSALAGKNIVSATLYLHNITNIGTNLSFPIHAILAANSSWGEAAQWAFAVPSSQRWAGDTGGDGGTDAGCSVAGTDYNATPIGTMEYLANSPADTEHTISLDVAQFQAMVSANHGMLVRRDPTGIFSMHSSNAATEAFRPRLVVEYNN